MALSLSAFNPALKSIYSNQVVQNLTYSNRPLYAMVAKKNDFFGKNYPLPIIIGNPQRRSATFSMGQANSSSSLLKDFTLLRKPDYSFATVSNEALEASENDKGAFLKALTVEVDGAMGAAADSAASDLYGDGGGTIGQLDSAVILASTTALLRNVEDIVKINVGQRLQFASAKTGGTLRNSGAYLTVTAVDRNAGSFTVDANLSTVTGITVNDYIVMQGDYDAKLSGLEAWLPYGGPSASAFFGVDRTIDSERLGGISFDGSGMPVEEALIKMGAKLFRAGAKTDKVFLGVDKYSELELSLGTKVQYVFNAASDRADISFKAIKLNLKGRSVDVVCDPFLTSGFGYMLQMDTWGLYSLKEPIRILMSDGNKSLRVSNEDANEVRIGGYKQLGCNAPGWNGVIQF